MDGVFGGHMYVKSNVTLDCLNWNAETLFRT